MKTEYVVSTNFHIIEDISDEFFRNKIEEVHLEECYLVENKCLFGDKNCPAKPISYCNH
jgi:hypothetical protein